MRHRADDKDIKWMSDLAEQEITGKKKEASSDDGASLQLGDHNPFGESFIDKLAAEDLNNMSMEEIEKKIDSANSIEELNALEEQLKAMDNVPKEQGSDAPPSAVPGVPPTVAPGTSDPAVQKDVQEIKEMLHDENSKTQNQLLDEIRKLNQAMGADKQVDLNKSFEQ